MTLVEPANDPCMQIQVDLSAMLDGELDAPSVRRVMVHSDVCPACRDFLAGIRNQARLHRTASRDLGPLVAGAVRAAVGDGGADSTCDGSPADRLRRQLIDNRRKLARILYELGRGFALMGLSSDFWREIGREPVPVPDMAMRGRSFLDEMAHWANGAGQNVGEWVAARDLFEQGLCSPAESLAKGQRLLSECLLLASDHHEARIYLGLVHHVRGQRSLARRQFVHVLDSSVDPVVRGFALLNLGNVCMHEGDPQSAVELLQQVVDSGLVKVQPRFGMAYFNLALALGLQCRFDESIEWFRRLHDELPHKRPVIARELTKRSQFVHLLRSHPDVESRLQSSFPSWFPVTALEAS